MCLSCAGPLDIRVHANDTKPAIPVFNITQEPTPPGITINSGDGLSVACSIMKAACTFACQKSGAAAAWQCTQDKFATCVCEDGSTPQPGNLKVVPFVDPSTVVPAPNNGTTGNAKVGSLAVRAGGAGAGGVIALVVGFMAFSM